MHHVGVRAGSLPDSDNTSVDNELQDLILSLLKTILAIQTVCFLVIYLLAF
ncbi:hypothetical protein [Dendronalium sp. ChiSLP03b]|uniref:hypothetical protein n=1 Tax=Dendronalium sp. ChiSLP03b TaxID=3075381 RepID=UPI00269DE128